MASPSGTDDRICVVTVCDEEMDPDFFEDMGARMSRWENTSVFNILSLNMLITRK